MSEMVQEMTKVAVYH